MVCVIVVVVGWIIGSEGKVESFRYCFVSIVLFFRKKEKPEEEHN